jgi:hypothetical protein
VFIRARGQVEEATKNLGVIDPVLMLWSQPDNRIAIGKFTEAKRRAI